MNNSLSVPIGPLVKKSVTVEINFTGLAWMRWRFALAAQLFRFAGWVAGTQIEIGVQEVRQREVRYNSFDRDGLPLRMSIYALDHVWEDGVNIEVLLDGVIQKQVVAFDREEGWILRNVLKDGLPFFDPESETVPTETVFGDVTVERRPTA